MNTAYPMKTKRKTAKEVIPPRYDGLRTPIMAKTINKHDLSVI